MTTTVTSQTGLFAQLEPLLAHRAVLITVSRLDADQLQVNICPRQLKEGENSALCNLKNSAIPGKHNGRPVIGRRKDQTTLRNGPSYLAHLAYPAYPLAQRVHMPPGYYIEWSRQYENQIRAKERLQIVIPIVLVIIFVMLYMTYNSVKEALHVLLAVPFALTGGVFLLKYLDYNFSVAVWVGFIALFGTAVQTGVVMVIYLDEAVRRKIAETGSLTRSTLREAVMEGALLRLRPKVMTVATVVAGLLPIMWSTRTGAEVMKPLATPVLGGMISSLIHVLIVTPVIFIWLREREITNSVVMGDHPGDMRDQKQHE